MTQTHANKKLAKVKATQEETVEQNNRRKKGWPDSIVVSNEDSKTEVWSPNPCEDNETKFHVGDDYDISSQVCTSDPEE